ncbi:Down syndrome cell adhesion molecule-like protein Dscam2 [Limulus polyphemus]|uniref:Down syndrome cell adhesion molecule-like protein Dscam2 n=1 Tax=Limulus polyphemus TaxID=6850 RepID=A0ABM1TNA4_LIMPO|nr:Down syndrome cell adhesion molecule-like protein Dscam2 [Limulus polyphemus]
MAGTLCFLGGLMFLNAVIKLVECLDLPRIQPFTFPTKAELHTRVNVLCSLSKGTLPVTFMWIKYSGPLVELADKIEILSQRDSSQLQIKNLSGEDVGNYTCVAKNTAGETRFTAELLVEGRKIKPVLQWS